MTAISATFRVTTPMFSGGADGTTAELRAASFKGVLRFWWRACAWSHFDGNLDRIGTEERHVFGSPSTGQSRLAIRIEGNGARAVPPTVGMGARYLGYGVIPSSGGNQAAGADRTCLVPPFSVTAELRARDLAEEQMKRVVEAVRVLGTIGGMGARSRRGYGSLSLLSMDGVEAPRPATSVAELRTQLRDFARGGPDDLPAYTALSARSRLLVGRPKATAMCALNDLGERYKQFRRSEGLKGDAGIVLNGRPADGYPRRVAFGLPINYGEKNPVVRPTDPNDRRASPLFFHIHHCGDQAVAVASFLPGLFLPRLTISIQGGRRPASTVHLPDQPDELYGPVNAFLEDLRERGGFTEVGEEHR